MISRMKTGCISGLFVCTFVYLCLFNFTHNVSAISAYVPSPHVVELKAEDMETFFAVNKESIIIFFDPEDSSKIGSYEEFSKLAAAMHRQVQFASMTKDEVTGQEEMHVTEFPEIGIIKEDEPLRTYKGVHKSDEIKTWIRATLKPAVQNIADQNALDTFLEDRLVGIVGMFPTRQTTEYKVFAEIAEEYRHLECFGYMKSDENTIKIYKENEDTSEYTGVMSEDEIRKWIEEERLPLFGEISDETFELYADVSRDMAFALLSDSPHDMAAQAEKYRDEITPVAKMYKDKLTFAWLDPKELADQLQGWMSLEKSEIPAIVVSTSSGRYKYTGEIKTEKLKQFIQDLFDGKLKPTIQSAPAPEKNDGPVRVVVGNTFVDEVINAHKDVVLMVQVPWHDQQAAFTKTFTDVAKSVKSKDIMFAQINIAENDVPSSDFASNQFPSVFYLKKGTKVPVAFEEESIAEEALKMFLNQNCETQLKFDGVHEEL